MTDRFCSVKGCGKNSFAIINEKRYYCCDCYRDFQKIFDHTNKSDEYSIRFVANDL